MEAACKSDGGEQSHPRSSVEAPGDASMDSYLRSQGLYRKRVAKDGSCLFRAVAEQVLHSQSRHVDVRNACINYLRKNREKFEAFIEGPFEEYLKCLENPQEWVGQVEISALSLMYKKDFIIYQEPNASPSHVTENGFPDQVLLCFSNGNHYDIVYPIEYTQRAALCQSLLYELLYEKVFCIDVNKILVELSMTEENNGNSEVSDSDSEDNCKSKTTAVTDMNGLKSLSGSKHLKNNGNPTSFLPKKILKSLNPSVYRNVEYEVWLQSKQDQQKRDFSIAAGMQYSVGDKCKVRLDPNGKYYNAHIQEVCSDNGPFVVFVEELGEKHSVSLKSLKPLPQASPMEGWNTVSGKKIKKFSSACGQNVQSEADCRGPKNQSKPIKTQSVLSPRQQYAVGTRQHQFSCSGSQSQQISTEHKTLGRNPSQPVRKPDRERAEDVDYISRDCNYFGLSPEERREKQAIEESRSLYEIQQRDEQAFPALSNHSVCQAATQTADTSIKLPAVTERRNSRWKSDMEEQKDKDGIKGNVFWIKDSNSRQIHLSQKFESNSSEKNGGNDKFPKASSPLKQEETHSQSSTEQKLTERLPCVNPTPSPVFSEVHLPPTVPSIPTIVPAWQNEPTYGPTGIPTQIPVSSLMPAPTTGPDSVVSQATSAPVAGVPLSLQTVNQPLMPLPPTLNPYQDPLFPGFPFSEKGERAIAPPYSLCNTGDDLPKDKNILRFFFNLGVKAYSCPMWAPHSYLYPLHQAYLASCRMYPKVSVPVYPHNPWFQEAPPNPNENETAQTDRHFPMQNEAKSGDHSPQIDTRSPSLPLMISTAQVSESQGQVCVNSENPVQALQSDQDESVGGKNMFLHPPFGHNQFLGAVPIAPPFFPHFWYGYPFPGFMENSVVRANVMSPEDTEAAVSPSANRSLTKECSIPVPAASCVEHLQKAMSESNSKATPLSVAGLTSECDVLNETSTRMPKVEQICTAVSPAKQVKPALQNRSTQMQGNERQTVVSHASPSVTEPSKNELKSRKEKPEKARDSKATDNLHANVVESRTHRTREESSEDENEVSDMLRSGRSKQFYNQTYGGGRRPRNEWGYPSSRGGYQYPRNEEAWKGQPNRSRDEGYQYNRNLRGRPYRNDRRRATMGENQRGHLA
uniref:OTU domain-containing protein 4 n=1 Tax=Pelodiscus sinensis TaxID=13735 RepID=K7FF59_PELSI|nr:OTU domain-containing protein 4 [Pelodiscus sinensis]|eukprot:XP_014433380.1 OTU domain-containing protein 4 [Pelodiscus sinensis]